ncbi:unnamed protein product, partial [marine sediment metagenome]
MIVDDASARFEYLERQREIAMGHMQDAHHHPIRDTPRSDRRAIAQQRFH